MSNYLYGCIEGSYCKGLQNENSDLDIIEVYDATIAMESNLKNVININVPWPKASRQIFSSQSFIYNLFYEPYYEYYRWLFPYKYLSDNELTFFIKKYNEDIIKENLPLVYERLMRKHDSYMTLAQITKNSKHYEKALEGYMILIEYQKNKSYKESLHFPSYKQSLLGIRNSLYSIKDIFDFDKNLKEKVNDIKSFYLSALSGTQYQKSLIDLINHTSNSKFYI